MPLSQPKEKSISQEVAVGVVSALLTAGLLAAAAKFTTWLDGWIEARSATFGNWEEKSAGFGKEMSAALTDGLVVATVRLGEDIAQNSLVGHVELTPGGGLRAVAHDSFSRGQGNPVLHGASIVFPVRKGCKWKVAFLTPESHQTVTPSVYWIPLAQKP